jgi:short-subunit dehydrogenase
MARRDAEQTNPICLQRDESSTKTLKAIRELGRNASIYTADLSSAEDVAELIPKILADGHQIRILVNCAGIQRRHPCEKFPSSDFNEVRAWLISRVTLLTSFRVGPPSQP